MTMEGAGSLVGRQVSACMEQEQSMHHYQKIEKEGQLYLLSYFQNRFNFINFPPCLLVYVPHKLHLGRIFQQM